MPGDDDAEVAEYMLVDDARNLEDYLARFDVTLSVMQRPRRSSASRELIDAAATAFGTSSALRAGAQHARGTLEGDAVEAPLRGLERAESGRARWDA